MNKCIECGTSDVIPVESFFFDKPGYMGAHCLCKQCYMLLKLKGIRMFPISSFLLDVKVIRMMEKGEDLQ